MEDDSYKKLPLEDRCVHKLWKARVHGYEELTTLFRQIDDEKSPEFAKYLGLVKKFVVDSNAMGQEKGLEATLAYVENYALAGKTVSEVMSGIVTKCIAAPKTKTRELSLQVTLMYIEIEKQEAVLEELIKGMEQKNPKIVAACISACTTALKDFGAKIISVKPLVKKISTLFADRDKTVRDESRLMVIEIYRWIGPALKPQLANLQPVQVTELEAEFGKVEGQKAVPTRYVRSQQEKQAKMAAQTEEVDAGGGDEEGDDEPMEIDPYELASPVDILSKMPKDFYEKIEAKKWQERKEALEAVETLLKTPRLESGDYGDLVRALKKIVQKDSNVVVVAIAGRCIALLAAGLKKGFSAYAGACVPALLEKFKEKKQNVVTAIRDAVDAVYFTTNLETILEDIVEALGSKNPSVKTETSLFLARVFTKTQPTAVNKKLLKALCGSLVKNINEPDPGVRDASAEAIGTLMKLVGEKLIAPFLIDLEKDNLKMSKVRECCEKAVITVKVAGPKKERPATVPKSQPKTAEPVRSAPVKTAIKKNPVAPARKKPISSGTATVVRSKGPSRNAAQPAANKTVERAISDEEAEEIASTLLSTNVIPELADTNWKTRLAAVENISNTLRTQEAKSIPTQAIMKTLAKKPGFKDTNFQVLKAKLDVIKFLAENSNFSTTSAELCIGDISEKFGDPKNGASVGEVMTAIAEATSLSFVSGVVMEFAFAQKSPKVIEHVLLWMSTAIKEFGFGNMNPGMLIDNSKKALASSNPQVRQAGISLLGTMYLYMGMGLHSFFENEKSSLRDQINIEFDKHVNGKPPVPIRGLAKSTSSNTLDDPDEEEAQEPEINPQDLMPRVDISGQITEALINELSDKNWKVRNEALTKITAIIQEAKFIKPNIGDLPHALSHRLTDSNIKLAHMAIIICESIAKAMGPPCKQYIRTLFPGFLQALGDSKSWMRTASLDAINAFADQCGYKEFFEGEMIGDALKSGSPTLRSELWTWLAEKLPKINVKSIPKEELMVCIPHLYSNLEDRNADVRKNAQEAILGVMIHVGYETMVKQTEKLKPWSKMVVMGLLEKVRPNLPVKPLPKKPAVAEKEDKVVKGTKPVANAKNAVKKVGVPAKAGTTSTRKKEEDVDLSPLLSVNNLKHQRSIDESKLKVLKWNFTQPREEFVDLLKDQMSTANVNKTLMANMFHSDFRYHIKAIESLSEDLPNNGHALISNLDLILKWLTLRFFDTNPSVLLKGLEYLQSVFNMLIENKYQMLENEASSFLPYLVLKIGDPKDSVRNGVRVLFKQICNIYSVAKLFSYIMEGLKSKNARQRAECLDAMGSIIEDYGINVCGSSPAACLKEVAKQISDRDNAVRNAALNCVVQAYFIVNDKVFKMVGNISDKDMSLLEERIKRSRRKPPKELTNPDLNSTITLPKSPTHVPQNDASPVRNGNDTVCHDNEEEDNMPQVTLNLPRPTPVEPEPEVINGPFRLDPDFLKELDKMTDEINKMKKDIAQNKEKLGTFDVDFLEEEVKIPTYFVERGIELPVPPKLITPTEVQTRIALGSTFSPSKTRNGDFDTAIKKISSPDKSIAAEGIAYMQEVLQSNKGDSLVEYENEFMYAITQQLSQLAKEEPSNSVLVLYKKLLTVIDFFYKNDKLGRKLNIQIIKDLLNEMITLLVEEKIEKYPNGELYVRVINMLCVKIIDNSDHTNIICALVQLLHESIRKEASPRYTDLVTKSNWKMLKLMPSWAEEIDFDLVILEIHFFLKEFPSFWWKNKPSDTPLRTIKTILHYSVKIKGHAIFQHLEKIPNTKESEVEPFLNKLVKSLKVEDGVQAQGQAPKRGLSRANHNMLTDIFQKIGNKEETKEGLTLLYDFMQQHPEADIEPFLKKTTKFFQDYIKNGLSEIEDSRKTAKTSIVEKAAAKSTESRATPQNIENKGVEYWKQRLEFLNSKSAKTTN